MRWSFAANWAQQGFNAAFTFILAALLGPEAFGIAAIATIFIMFTHILVGQGLALPLIQKDDLTQRHLDSAFWALLVWSVLMAMLAAAMADWWGKLNGDPLVSEILVALCPLLVVQGLYVVPKSRLMRSLNFRSVAFISIVSSVLSGAAGVGFALAGADVWSLVVFQWVAQVANLVLFWAMAWKTPRLAFSFSSLKELLYTGSGAFLSQLGGFAISRGDSVLIGVFFGPIAVGLYRLADRLVQLLVTLLSRSLTSFALPFLSRAQADPERFKRGTRDCLELSSIISIPPLALLAALSPLVVEAIGEEWGMAWIAVLFLSIVGAVQSLTLLSPQLMNAAGRAHLAALISWVSAGFQASCFILVGLVARDEPVFVQIAAISGSKAAIFVLVVLPFHAFMIRLISGVSSLQVLKMLVAPLTCAVFIGSTTYAILLWDPLEALSPILKLIVYGSAGACLTVVSMVAANQKIREEVRFILSTAKSLRFRTRKHS